MQLIKSHLQKYQPRKSTITNERQLLIRDFLDRLNQDRLPPYKPLSPARVGMLLRFCSNSDLKHFYALCSDAKNFSKFFWWRLKNNN